MGTLFRLKQYLTGTDGRTEGRYVCLSCYASFEVLHQVCPVCDGYDIRRTEWVEENRGPPASRERS
jgi:rRNA maturation endonuclease Nob1